MTRSADTAEFRRRGIANLPASRLSQDELHAANLSYIQSPGVREAYRLLCSEAFRAQLETNVLETSTARPVRFYGHAGGGNRYLFSFDRAQHHLKFHIRKPALNLWDDYRRLAEMHVAKDELIIDDQVKIWIRTRKQAENLIRWTFRQPRWELCR